ncbi:MAG: hypothetical protein D6785_09480 [Planctomycetota bacterium]|nr:MAG: hypothetical protein D6785_09480 [Planctomycetota bacterium]
MSTLVQILFQISNILLLPVMIGLILLFGFSIFETGRFLPEGCERKRKGYSSKKQEPFQEWEEAFHLHIGGRHYLQGFLEKIQNSSPEYWSRHLWEKEQEIQSKLSILLIGVRIGPVLGLMGTLIPLGPALMSLSKGDIKTLSIQLVIAFSTTVLGLASGAFMFWFYQVRKNWYAQDLMDMEWILEIKGKINNEKS